jgi:hypothetical protein
MHNKWSSHKLRTAEILLSGLVGAASPYLVSFLIHVGPTKVPLWVAFAGALGGFVLTRYVPAVTRTWLVVRSKTRQTLQDLREIHDRLAQVEQAVKDVRQQPPPTTKS